MGERPAEGQRERHCRERRPPTVPSHLGLRTEDSGGKTSPEELLASAHASCCAMALSATLSRKGKAPERLEVTAVVSFERVGDGWKVTASELKVRGRVAGLDAVGFEELARTAEKTCPISNAIRDNVEIKLSAELA